MIKQHKKEKKSATKKPHSCHAHITRFNHLSKEEKPLEEGAISKEGDGKV